MGDLETNLNPNNYFTIQNITLIGAHIAGMNSINLNLPYNQEVLDNLVTTIGFTGFENMSKRRIKKFIEPLFATQKYTVPKLLGSGTRFFDFRVRALPSFPSLVFVSNGFISNYLLS